jgi:hypothetical protein
MMEIIFVLGVFVAILLIVHNAPQPGDPSRKSDCPPHAWTSIEVKNKDGEIEGYKLICKKCGPINKA